MGEDGRGALGAVGRVTGGCTRAEAEGGLPTAAVVSAAAGSVNTVEKGEGAREKKGAG